ncbi:MAG: response regulator [Planctomycetota bacterium]|jgi:DNA-binding response OmpR family regulator
MRVLIADDDAVTLRLLEALLVKWGFDVVLARDGDEAWAVLAADDRPRLVVLDWQMPGRDGVEICRRLGELEGQPTYVILLTSRAQKEDVVEGLESGANDYVTKPFDREELRARVRVGERVLELQSALERRVAELMEANSHIKVLQGILPICMFCKSIRTDEESWQRIEAYVLEHSEAKFSHSLCPPCKDKHYPPELINRGAAAREPGA